MANRLRWLGHSALLVDTGTHKILMDPFLNGNPTAAIKPDEAEAHFIIVSHGHGDHVGDTVDIAKRNESTVITNFEISGWFKNKHGLTNLHGLQHGGGVNLEFGRVKLTQAWHGSQLPDGSDGGNPCGVILYLPGDQKIYNAADTGLFGDMKLIGEEGIDLAILPIGDYFTMGPDDSIRAIKFIEPKKVLPIHYNTFPPIQQDVNTWAERVKAETNAEPIVLKPGDWMDV
ncbi:MAG: metal-dependent hydrolase [Gemmataceae bacterium]